MNRRQARISTAGRVAAMLLQMIQERTNQHAVQIRQRQRRWRLAQMLCCVAEQQPERVAIGSDGMGTGIALSHESICKE